MHKASGEKKHYERRKISSEQFKKSNTWRRHDEFLPRLQMSFIVTGCITRG